MRNTCLSAVFHIPVVEVLQGVPLQGRYVFFFFFFLISKFEAI